MSQSHYSNHTNSTHISSNPNTSNLKVVCRIRPPKSYETQKEYKKTCTSTSISSPSGYTCVRNRSRSGSKDMHSPTGQHYQSQKQTNSKKRSSSRLSSSRSSSQNNKSSSYQSQVTGHGLIQADKKYCVFTTKEKSNVVVACESAVSGKTINEQIVDKNDLKYFNNNVLGSESMFSFNFDQVFNESHKQEKFYQSTIRPAVKSFVEGNNACVLLFGATEGGKTYTLKGKTGLERGILPRAIEDVFNIVRNSEEREDDDFDRIREEVLRDAEYGYDGDNTQFGSTHRSANITSNRSHYSRNMVNQGSLNANHLVSERMFLKVAVYQIFADKVLDLLVTSGQSSQRNRSSVRVDHFIDKNTEEVVSKLKNITEKVVFTLEDFYSVLQEAFKNRRIESVNMQEQDLRKKSHLVINLQLMKRTSTRKLQEISHMNFIELSGSEQAVAEEKFYKDSSIRTFVTKSFNSLSAQLLRSALQKKVVAHAIDDDSKIVNCVRNTLTQNSNIVLVCCVNPGVSQFEHSLPAIKFCARIRDCIINKLKNRSKYNTTTGLQNATISSSASFEKFEYNKTSHKGGETERALASAAYDTFSNLIQQLKEDVSAKQYSLQSDQYVDKQLLERWVIDKLEIIDRITHRLSSKNNDSINIRKNQVLIDDLRYLTDKINKLQQTSLRPQSNTENFQEYRNHFSNTSRSVRSGGGRDDDRFQNTKDLELAQQEYVSKRLQQTNNMLVNNNKDNEHEQQQYQYTNRSNYNKQSYRPDGTRQYQQTQNVFASEQKQYQHQEPVSLTSSARNNDYQNRYDDYRQNSLPTPNFDPRQSVQSHQMSGYYNQSDASIPNHLKQTPSINQIGLRSPSPQSEHPMASGQRHQPEAIHKAQQQFYNSSFQHNYNSNNNDTETLLDGTLQVYTRNQDQPNLFQQTTNYNNEFGDQDDASKQISQIQRIPNHNISQYTNLTCPENEFLNKAHPHVNRSQSPEKNNISSLNNEQYQNVSTNVTAVRPHPNQKINMSSNNRQQTDNSLQISNTTRITSPMVNNQRNIRPQNQSATNKSSQLKQTVSNPKENYSKDQIIQNESVYNTEEEVLNDLNRLIRLNDFEGLKLRVVELFKEKAAQQEIIEAQEEESNLLKEDLQNKDEIIETQEKALLEKQEEYEINLGDLHSQKQESEKDTREQQLQQNAMNGLLQSQLKTLQEDRDKISQDLAILREENKQLEKQAVDAVANLQKEREVSDRLKSNYDILKEHEMNIITDMENKKGKEAQFYEQQINDLHKRAKETNQKEKEMEEFIFKLREDLRKVELELNKTREDKNTIQEEYESMVSQREGYESEKLRFAQELEQLDKEYQAMSREKQRVESERHKAFDEIDNLHTLIEEMEQKINLQQQKVTEEASLRLVKQKEIDEALIQISQLEQQIEIKNKELDGIHVKEQTYQKELGQMAKINDEIEKQLTLIKAKEYDKVDLMKRAAELEARLKYLQVDNEHLVKERNNLDIANVELSRERNDLEQHAMAMESELEFFRKTHEEHLDRFDQKFDAITTELTKLKNENIQLKEREKGTKRHIREVEEERDELRYKGKELEASREDMYQRMCQLEREVRSMMSERELEMKNNVMRQSIELRQKDETKGKMLGEISSLIKQFKDEKKNGQSSVKFGSTSQIHQQQHPTPNVSNFAFNSHSTHTSGDYY